MPREKSKHRDRRSLSYSSESSYERKKSKHKRRSRSRDRSESSYRKKRSSSRSKNRRRSYSRSVSKERYKSKSKRRSTSRPKSKRSKHSRDKSRSRSSSRSRSKRNKSKKHRRRSLSTNSRDSFDIDSRKPNLDDTETKIEKAIKAAEAAGLTMTKIPTYEYKDVEIKEDMPTIHDRNLLAEINSDSFMPKTFTSSRNKKQQNIVIDLNTETVKVPEAEIKSQADDSIINFDKLPSLEELKEMWIKKLYMYRKKMLKEEI